MKDEQPTNPTLRGMLDRLDAGDRSAIDQLVAYAVEQFRGRARKLLRGKFERVRRWDQTDDVLQGAALRLQRALLAVHPQSGRHFARLVNKLIDRELVDLIRHHYGPEGAGAHHRSDLKGKEEKGLPEALINKADARTGPKTIAERKELHALIEQLPDEEREVIQQMFYLDATQQEVADRLGVSVSTVKRRYRNALLLLHKALHGTRPDD